MEKRTYPAAYRFGNWNNVCHSAAEYQMYSVAHTLSETLNARRSWGINKPLSVCLNDSAEAYHDWAKLMLMRELLGALIELCLKESTYVIDIRQHFAYLEPIYPE
jgi:hypothetical protein